MELFLQLIEGFWRKGQRSEGTSSIGRMDEGFNLGKKFRN